MSPLDPPGSRKSDIRPHRPRCKLAVGIVKRGNVGCMFIRVGGWDCAGCIDEKLEVVADHLARVVTTRILWLGELDEKQRRAASRLAQRLPQAGRITATRYTAPILMLSEANITPRSKILRPALSLRAALGFIEQARDGPMVKRLDWDRTWRPPAESRNTDTGIRAGMGPHDLWERAVELAGFRPGYPLPAGISDIEAAAAIEEELEDLREGNDKTKDPWGRTILVDNAHDVS